MSSYKRNGRKISRDVAFEEFVADSMESMLADGEVLAKLKAKDQTLWETITNYITTLIAKIKKVYEGLSPDSAEGRYVAEWLDSAQELRDMWVEALEGTRGVETKNETAEVKESARAEYISEIDQWNRDGRLNGEVFVLGSTSDVLQGLGAMENDIFLRSEKINEILKEHPEMTLEEIKKIPQTLENPVLILMSRNVGREDATNSRMVLFGTLKAQNGQPVMAVLDLRPEENHIVIDDMQKVASAYTKTNNPVGFIRKSDIMYATKKAPSLLRTIGFQVPIALNESGFIGSRSYSGPVVKLSGKKFSEVFSEDRNTAKKKDAMYSDRSSTTVENTEVSEQAYASLDDEYSSITSQMRKAKAEADSLSDRSKEDALMDVLGDKDATAEEREAAMDAYTKWADESGYNDANARYKELESRQREIYRDRQRMAEALSKQLREKEYTAEEISKYASKAVRKFHTTSRLSNAAYLLTTGSMLDFSEGQGYRVKDHREIAEILDLPDYAEYSDGMVLFMNMGNIRLQTYGIDISAMPNGKQISALRGIIQQVMNEYDEFSVDFSLKDGNNATSITYPKGTSTTRIINDIKAYFENGTIPEEPSSISQFRYSDRYSYDELVSKPDMQVTTLPSDIPGNRADIVSQAKKNAVKVGKFNTKDGSVSVYVDDIDTDVVLSTHGLRHSLDRRLSVNAPVVLKAGEILKNSIKINELTAQKPEADHSYVLIGAARGTNNDLYIVRSVVNSFSNEVSSMDVLYAINAKKESAALLPKITENTATRTDSSISIAQLLEFVNTYFPDVLPESVLRHFGYESRPDGKIGESALYSDRDPEAVSNREILAGALESVAANDIEKNKLSQYKAKIEAMDTEQKKLKALRAEIKEISFSKGKRDTARLAELREEATAMF